MRERERDHLPKPIIQIVHVINTNSFVDGPSATWKKNGKDKSYLISPHTNLWGKKENKISYSQSKRSIHFRKASHKQKDEANT